MIEKIKNFFSKNAVKMTLKILGIIISTLFFITINTVINYGYLTITIIPAIVVCLVGITIYLIGLKRKKYELNIEKKEIPEITLNSLTLGIFLNTIFILVLSLIVNEASYIYSFGNYAVYGQASTGIYLLSSVIILPLLRNILIRRNLGLINNKLAKTIVSYIFVLLLLITAPTLITGIYLAIITLIINIKYIKEKNIAKATLTEMIISLSLSLMTLYLSKYKIVMILIMSAICLVCFVNNFRKIKKEEV